MAKIKSEIRRAYFFDKYVIITPGRAKRPRDVEEREIIKKTGHCPFCPENLRGQKIIAQSPAGKNWQIADIENKYPSVTRDNSKAYGVQEVIIETPDHEKELASLPEKQIESLLAMFSARTAALAKDKKIDYILCFKNQGSRSGASISHAHSQIFASAIVPPNLKEEAAAALAYHTENKTCPYCDIIKKELKSSRLIWADRNIVAFTPYASEYHYEAWVCPRRHLDNITELSAGERRSLARALKKILAKIDALGLSFNFFLHNVKSDPNQHFYIKVQPRDNTWAGVELGSGLVINSVPPEEAARYYRR